MKNTTFDKFFRCIWYLGFNCIVNITLLNQKIIYKDKIKIVTQFSCFLRHPVHNTRPVVGSRIWGSLLEEICLSRMIPSKPGNIIIYTGRVINHKGWDFNDDLKLWRFEDLKVGRWKFCPVLKMNRSLQLAVFCNFQAFLIFKIIE